MQNIQLHPDGCGVKVMRSHDYCHFEVCLSSNLLGLSYEERVHAVDDLRKTAARLADRAVEQYRLAKANVELAMTDKSRLESIRYRYRDILEKPEAERTPEEKATVKAIEDRAHRSRPRYDYQEDWEEPDDEDDEDEMF